MAPPISTIAAAVEPLPVIFDCDPGKDDSLALFLAFALPDTIDILGITTVAGNVPVEHTSRNARRIVEAAGRQDIPVYPGCARPLMGQLVTAEHVHGADGLGGSGLPDAERAAEDFHAVDALVGFLEGATTPLVIAAIGPLTNIAMVLMLRPDLVPRIRQLAVMGGARTGGNVTRNAEFNIFADPHAAQIVLSGEVPVSVVPLDITRKLWPPVAWFEAMKGFGEPGRAVAAMWRESPVALHDVAVTGLLAWPDLFTLEACSIQVVWNDEASMGRTVFETGSGSAHVVRSIRQERFLERVAEAMRVYRF